jgi:misacylated tRNA(Ala) deacylase
VTAAQMTETQWRTHRLELADQSLREWDTVVLAAGPDGIVLDSSAFCPGGGGQPPDHGVLRWGGVQTRIVGARKGNDLYLIPAEDDPLPPPGTAVSDHTRRSTSSARNRRHLHDFPPGVHLVPLHRYWA